METSPATKILTPQWTGSPTDSEKTMITLPSYDSDRIAYSLAMKAYILADYQLYNLSKGKPVGDVDISRIDFSDLVGKKSLNLSGIHKLREGWICELNRHISSGHRS
ncbi:hypothetical protein [Endozoicomonas sp. SCSIO W0465]|uniref:hypothetical protein n=1 Tax=Endozoicomonas sp. SCSIO W0465 TaxID=2918516 RepID=UPI002075D05D|nr:hypothetical protein [Endozoicomonas sp. SCSIO W0465]USE35125.1 hypothetical protein MJO57_23905 [Endozoicomonas sp. SCSIO W0465]